MPANSSSSVTLNIQAQVTGYEQSIKDMRQTLEKLDPGSKIGKNLKKGLDEAEKHLKSLMKNVSSNVSSNAQIEKVISDVNKLGETLASLGEAAQDITGKDLKLSALGEDAQSVIADLQKFREQLDNNIGKGIEDFIKKSDKLQESLSKILGTDVTKLGYEEIFKRISAASQEAEKNVKKTQDAVEKAQKVQTSAQAKVDSANTRQKKIEQSEIDLTASKDKYLDSYKTIYKQLTDSMIGLLGEDKSEIGKEILDKFFDGLTPETAKDKVEEIVKAINDALGTKTLNVTKFKSDFLGLKRGQSIYKNEMLGEMKAAQEEARENITANEGISPTQAAKAIKLIDEGQIEKGVEDAIKRIKEAKIQIQREINKAKDELASATETLETAKQANNDVLEGKSNLDSIQGQLKQKVDELTAKNKELEDRIAELEQQKDTTLNTAATTVKQEMGRAGKSARDFEITREEANKYSAALEKVQNAEQALGRLKGVVQQWFSVYAAVRMVTKAIRNIINTLTSLDKVITEIAIVTNMTQSELWGQMNSYAKMAQTYAASIEGVYQVSQLYYQQGLQTADVMALTEQTLKMARISGLGYAEATDYMTNAVRAFNMEMTDAQRVVDVYSAVAASSATNTTELAEAMSKTASSAHAVGSSFENTTAMMAVMIESTRESAQNIGSSLKSIISRYGEMKADPSALVDSEGQEMSLNKVDKALQSVGISIHDATGQFRDFDDVIMELAASWDSIDRNTQRYIATIMAGNRQQSRFLALVSGYDRLKELSEEAMNSEDASQLQFLKTLDSVAAKTQQIKTSFQELYVNSGLEKFYKGLLDFGNSVVQTFTRMPKTFNLPILAIAKFSSTFISLATVVKTLFKTITNLVSAGAQRISLVLSLARNGQWTAEEQSAAKKLGIWKKYYSDVVTTVKTGEKEVTQAMNDGDVGQEATTEQKAAALKAQRSARWKTAGTAFGTAASLAGSAISLYAANIDETKNLDNRTKKAWWTAGGSALQGIGTGLTTGLSIGGPWGGLIGAGAGLLTSLPGIIEAVGLASESTGEKVDRLNKAIEDTNNKALQSKDELKSLEEYKEKYDELYKVRNKDAESRQEWLDLNAEIVANYPDLFGYMDAEGNYIADMTTNYENLLEIKRQNYEQDLLAATQAKIAAAADTDTRAAKRGVDVTGGVFSNAARSGVAGRLFDPEFEYVFKTAKEAAAQMFGGALSSIANGEQVTTISKDYIKAFGEDVLAALFSPGAARAALGKSAEFDPDEAYRAISVVFNSVSKGYKNIEDVNKQLEAEGFEGLTLKREPFLEIVKAFGVASSEIDDYNSAIEEGVRGLITYRASYDKAFSEISAITLDEVLDQAKTDFLNETKKEKYKGWSADEVFAEWWPSYIETIEDTIVAKRDELYSGIEKGLYDDVNNLYANLGKYSKHQIVAMLKKWGASDDLISEFIDKWDKMYGSEVASFETAMQEAYADAGLGYGAGYSQAAKLRTDFGAEQLSVIQSLYTDVLNNDSLSKTQKSTQIRQFNSLFTKVASLSQEQQEKFFANLANADLTTISGIYSFLDSLVTAGIEIDENGIRGTIEGLKDNISVNLATEFDILTESLVKNMSDFEKAISNASKGMDLSTATEMAQKLGTTLSNFRLENGKYFYDDIEKLEDAYLKENDAIISDIKGQRELLENISSITGNRLSKGKETKLLDFLTTVEDENWSSDDINTRIDYLKTLDDTLTDQQAQMIVDYYDRYYDAWIAAGKDAGDFYNYVMDQLDLSIDNYEEAKKYAQQQANLGLIQKGNFSKFFDRILGEFRAPDERILSAISTGDFSGLDQDTITAVSPYVSELQKAISSYTVNAFKNTIDAITNDKAYYGTATNNEEKALLESFGAEFYDGMNYVIQSSAQDFSVYARALREAYESGKISLQEYNSYYAQFKDAIAGENIGDAFIDAAKDYKHISVDTAQKLADSLGMTIAGVGMVYNELEKTYSIDPQILRARIQAQYQKGAISFEDYNNILKVADEYDRKNAPDTILKNIVDNRTKLTEADIESIAKLLDKNYDVVKEHLQQNADGTYTAGFAYLYSIMDAAGYEYNAAIEESLAKQYDDIIEQAIGIVSTQTKGYTKVADMKQFETQLANNGIDFGDSTLYEWDTDIHAFVLSAEGIKKQWELINKEIEGVDKNSDEYYYYTRLVNDTTRQLAENVYSQIANLISSDTATRAQATSKFKKAIDDYNTWLGVQIEGWEGIDSQLALSTIQGGGISAVAMAKTFAGLAGVQLSDSDIQELYRGRVAPLMDAIEQVTATAGEIVSKTAADIIRNAGGDVREIAGTGQYVVTTAANVVEAYHAIYEELAASGEATLGELNALKAKELESKYKVTELGYLSSAAEMSYEEFGQVLESMGIRLTEEIFDTLGENITQLSNGKLRINNFEGFARALGVDITSDAYISAFKAYNDSMINLNKQTEKAITEEVNAIGSAGLGDKINVTTLFKKLTEDQLTDLNNELLKWGANITDGILDIGENANLAEVINTIYNAVKGTDLMLEKDVEALADALDSVLKAFAEGLQKGITGTLTNAEAYDLQTTAHNMFGIDLDFTKTADGLKISAEQATTLYYRLREVDSFSARLVFDGLKDSLTETGEACESITSTLAKIHELEEQLSRGPDNAEVRERLNLYREIASVQMNDPSQYSFMDNKLPDMYQGPENYWNAWDEAFKSMKTAAQKGYISTQDFYNIVNEMSNVARLTGTPIMLMGEELDGSLEKASALIQKGFNALTIVEGQGAQIDLSNMGLQVTGIDDMTNMTDEALKQVAQANIDMLDSMIQLLEVVVAMEDLGKIDTGDGGDKDNILDINELFDELSPGLFEADEDTQAWAVKILAQAKDNEDLANALETLLIGEQSLGDIIKKLSTPGTTFTFDEANQYQKILQAFYDAYLNGDYDLENLQQSIIDIFSKEFGEVDTIQVGDKKYAIGYGTTLVPDENGKYVTTPDNAEFTDPKEALQHQAMLDAGILAENIGEYDTEAEITTGKKILKDGSSVTIEVGEQGIKYSVPGLPNQKFDSYDDAMSAWYAHEQSVFGEDKVGTREEWAAAKGWEIPITTDFSENADDPFYQIMVDGVRDVVVNLIEGDIPDTLKKIFGLDGGTPTPTPTTPTPSNGTNPTRKAKEKAHAVSDDAGAGIKNKGGSQNTTDNSSFDAASAALDTLKTAAQTLADAIPSVVTSVTTLSTAINNIPSGVSGRISSLALAMKQLPEKKTIAAIINFKFTGLNNNPPPTGTVVFKPNVKGNVALKSGRQRTLMGELGPELVVSKGRYFVVGQNGAEMVDLDPDAVVFNHLQTKHLLKNGKAGRGRAVTNERNAVSMATGNTSGPAMASAKAALQALKQLRAMWQSLLGASLSDLGALGGSGGGGGGGGGGKDPSKNNAGFIADLERWYNLLRQIAKLEKDINYEQTLRNKLSSDMLANGDAYYASVKRELDALNQTTAKQAELASIQKDFYDKRAKELESSNFGKIFKYDENGQIQYNDDYKFANGDRGGLFALAELNRQNPDGSSALTVEEQYNKLKAWGFENDMLYDSQGQKIEYDKENPDDFYTKSVQAFWDKADGWKDELDGYYDSFREAEQASVEAQVQANKLLQEMQDKEIELQEKVYQAIIDSREKEIKDLQDTADAFGEAADKYIDGLNQQLQREQQMYQNNKNEQDLEKNRRRLAILQRSGASASEIASLQSTIDDQSKQMYFDKQQQQIDAIQEASDAQLEKMNEQIELMQMSLDYEKSNGLLWGQVYEVMSGTPSQIADFIKTNSAEYQGLSAEQYSKMSTDLDDLVGFVKAYEEDKKEGKSPVDNQGEEEWKAARAQLATMPGAENFTDEQWAAAKQAYTEAIASGKGADEAYKAAEKVLKGEPKISEDQEKQAKTAAENYFNNTKKTDALKAKYGKDLYATAEAAAKRAYQEKYAEILANGGTVAEAEKAAEEALLDVFVTEERKGTVRNAFKDEEAFKKAVKKKLGKGAKINDDVWADALDDIQDAFETSFMDNGDESAAYAAAAQEYKKQLRITKAEEYWEDWVSKIKKKKKPKSDQKKMKDVLSSNKPIGVEQVNKAHDAFITNFKGGDKKKKRKNARAAAKKILLDAYKSKSYSQGGIVDYTGIANVHGTRTKPEAFLNADEVKMWRNDILGNHSGSLTSSLLDLNELVHNMVTGNDVIRETNNNGVSIENAVVNMNTTIANDYDAKRAGELALQQMLKIAQKTGNQGLSRR